MGAACCRRMRLCLTPDPPTPEDDASSIGSETVNFDVVDLSNPQQLLFFPFVPASAAARGGGGVLALRRSLPNVPRLDDDDPVSTESLPPPPSGATNTIAGAPFLPPPHVSALGLSTADEVFLFHAMFEFYTSTLVKSPAKLELPSSTPPSSPPPPSPRSPPPPHARWKIHVPSPVIRSAASTITRSPSPYRRREFCRADSSSHTPFDTPSVSAPPHSVQRPPPTTSSSSTTLASAAHNFFDSLFATTPSLQKKDETEPPFTPPATPKRGGDDDGDHDTDSFTIGGPLPSSSTSRAPLIDEEEFSTMFHTMLFLLEFPPEGFEGNPCCADCWYRVAMATMSMNSSTTTEKISVGGDETTCPFDWVAQCHNPVLHYDTKDEIIKLLLAKDIEGLTAALPICECRSAWKVFWHRKSEKAEAAK